MMTDTKLPSGGVTITVKVPKSHELNYPIDSSLEGQELVLHDRTADTVEVLYHGWDAQANDDYYELVGLIRGERGIALSRLMDDRDSVSCLCKSLTDTRKGKTARIYIWRDDEPIAPLFSGGC